MMTPRNHGQSSSEILCLECGLCCTGYLFTHASLKDNEVPVAISLGLPVDKQEISGGRYFELPCPLYDNKCSIYNDPGKPDKCISYKCKLLQDLESNRVTIELALNEVQRTKAMISEVRSFLPEDTRKNFCIELLPYLDTLERAGIRCDSAQDQILLRAGMLLALYSQQFGVTQLFSRRRKWLSQR